VKSTGDGLLAEFASIVDAVRCAVEIQRGMIDREPELPHDQRIRFRIGINLGDVIAEEYDIFGDGVNVAARLEALAEPGGICISRTVRDQIRDKLPYPLEDMGEQSVKNIARPVRVYALRPDGFGGLTAPGSPAQPSRRGWAITVVVAVFVFVFVAWWFWPAATLFIPSGEAGGPSDCFVNADAHGSGRHLHRTALVAPRLSIVVLPFSPQRRSGAAILRGRGHLSPDDRFVADRGQFRDLSQYRVHL
jgi:hypothetical protein